jgi:hypothetical protein
MQSILKHSIKKGGRKPNFDRLFNTSIQGLHIFRPKALPLSVNIDSKIITK